ncbi:MAG: low temperature requirement protein A [Solirubrobacterales bacterium]|nr:low temperature requirement protein A [Solirubrobacterales bacterium]
MSTEALTGRARRLTPVMRQADTVTPLELFFDLVFVLALTQCTALMAAEPTWEGLAKGLLVLGVLWWSWVGYAWLTSVIDPEEGAVRIVIFAAMAAMLVAALCVPQAFGDAALIFAIAYAFVRIAHIALFVLSSAEDPNLRKSVVGLGWSTAVGVGLLLAASFADGVLQGALWALALGLDMAGPAFFGVEGWRLSAHHFAERHGLIIIIALGESIVAIGVGVTGEIDLGIVAAAVIGSAIAAALWWLYFDVVALVAGRRLASAEPGREQNAIARDSYSFLHFPMVAGIVLVALGMKKTLGHVEDPLKLVPAAALFGGAALYLLAHVAFRYRHVHTLNTRRLALAVLLVALIALGVHLPALASIAILAALLIVLIVVETHSYGDSRARTREQLRHEVGAGH